MMLSNIILRIFMVIILLWAAWGIFAVSMASEAGEQMGLLGQMSYYFVLPNLVWGVIAYWLMKHFAINEIKNHITESKKHQKILEEKLEEISNKLEK